MARKSGVSSLLYTGALAALGLVAYRLGDSGQLGPQVQGGIDAIQGIFKTGPVTGTAPGPRGTPAAGSTTGGARSAPSGGGTGNLGQMQAQNPNVGAQMMEWQQLRRARGENPLDWEAFRAHERNMGNYDPGSSSPPEFVGFGVV